MSAKLTEARQHQPIGELERKARKASRRGFFTQEDWDLAAAECRDLVQWLAECEAAGRFDPEPPHGR